MPRHKGAHKRPPQTRAPGDGGVNLGHGCYTVIDEVKCFSVKRLLESIGNISFDFLSDMQRAHSDLAVERTCGTYKLQACLLTAHDFNQR